MSPSEFAEKIVADPEFVALRRFKYSLTDLETRYPVECPDHVIAGALMIKEEDVQARFAEITQKLKELIGVED